MNYYALFEFPVSPVIDKSVLAQKYFALQKKYHPDFFTQSTEEEQDEALKQSAAINKAFAIFQNKEKTIEYFLQEKGIIETDEKFQLPPDFLMEMMELNETLLEKEEADAVAELNTLEEALYEEIKPLLDNADSHEDKAALEKLKTYYYKKKYLKRVLDRLDL